MPSAERDLNADDALEDFDHRELTFLGETKSVLVAGSGPAVIVMTEIPGIHPYVCRFARWVRDAGFTVWMPSLFGEPGQPYSIPRVRGVLLRVCISREFRAFAANRSSPVVDWLRTLAAHTHPICGGRGVGAIGMCVTGNFALAMMLEPAMLAPVLSQPSLPLGRASGLHIGADELAQVRARMQREDLTVLAYRFAGDRRCRAERFAAYEQALGDRFIGHVLPDETANREGIAGRLPPHSVVTTHLIDRDGEPTRRARDEILEFFRERLTG
ncbi:MAG: dienelactone hydrolase family protein [Pseudonocardiaceae bacterium]